MLTEDDEEGFRAALRWMLTLAVCYFIVSTIAILVMIFLAARWAGAYAEDCETGAYGCGHEQMHPQYNEWNERMVIEDGMRVQKGSCCHDQDCRPVRATKDEDEDWKIYIPEFRDWVKVPRAAVTVPDRFHDGRNHACTSKPYPNMPRYITIYCFSPAQPKT